MKLIRDFVVTIVGGVLFTGWTLFILFVSKDAFEWKDMSFTSFISVILQALLVLFICFLPFALIGGYTKIRSKKNTSTENE